MIYLKGETVMIENKIQTGVDLTNRPVYESDFEAVENVFVGRPDDDEILETLNLTGRHLEYTLGIPKGDTHDWKNKKVIIRGEEFRTIGYPIKGNEGLMPLDWGQNVRVERYDNED